jgi:radical SAM protein (TIGR01212 family)
MTFRNYPWGHERRFHAYSNYNKKRYGERFQKVSLDAGFTCPNRDGTKGFGGCTYCNNSSFNPSYCDPKKPLSQQIEDGIDFLSRRYKVNKYLAYFQAYTNTYSSLEKMKRIFLEALEHKDIYGLVIGTRPDAVDEKKLQFLEELAKDFDVTLEYGIESIYDKTQVATNRAQTFREAYDAVNLSANRGIHVGAHIIFGLPGETREEMLYSADIISELPLNSVKLHQLHIVKKTVLANEYKRNSENFNLFKLDEYIEFIVNYLERLNPNFVVQRMFGEAPPSIMAGPTWGSLRNSDVLERIEKKLEERDTWQGRLYEKSPEKLEKFLLSKKDIPDIFPN